MSINFMSKWEVFSESETRKRKKTNIYEIFTAHNSVVLENFRNLKIFESHSYYENKKIRKLIIYEYLEVQNFQSYHKHM